MWGLSTAIATMYTRRIDIYIGWKITAINVYKGKNEMINARIAYHFLI